MTEERIVGGLRGIAGDRIEFGPIGAGPGKFARVSADGEFGLASAAPLEGGTWHSAYRSRSRSTCASTSDSKRTRSTPTIDVSLTLGARAAEPLRVVIDIDPPTWRDVTVTVDADGVRAEVLRRVPGIDREIGRFVARYVAREIDKPHIRKARDIDVAARIDGAWKA